MNDETQSKGKLALPSALYDISKDTTLIYLPATAVLYFGLATIWGWPYSGEVSGSIVAICTFLGVCLKISTVSYNNSPKSQDGVFTVDLANDKYSMDIHTPFIDVAGQKTITLKVDDKTGVSRE